MFGVIQGYLESISEVANEEKTICFVGKSVLIYPMTRNRVETFRKIFFLGGGLVGFEVCVRGERAKYFLQSSQKGISYVCHGALLAREELY